MDNGRQWIYALRLAYRDTRLQCCRPPTRTRHPRTACRRSQEADRHTPGSGGGRRPRTWRNIPATPATRSIDRPSDRRSLVGKTNVMF